jgi:protoheme IX farnesyltransferase
LEGLEPEEGVVVGNADGRPQGPFAVVKPRVLLLLVFTGVVSFVIASGHNFSLERMGWLLVGGVLATAGSNTVNNVLDKGRYSLMDRTMWRPIPAGRMSPNTGAVLGTFLSTSGFFILYIFLNPLTALLTLGGILFYIVVYTVVLKPRTYENITIGGIAGAFPPVVGWMAVKGDEVGDFAIWVPPLLLGLIVILWTPPHFWSLALFHKKDYQRAGIPMLPVVKGEHQTHVRIVSYTLLLVVVSLVMVLVEDIGSTYYYLGSVLALDVVMVYLSVRLLTQGTLRAARVLFMFSNVYLGLLFLTLLIDVYMVTRHFEVI